MTTKADLLQKLDAMHGTVPEEWESKCRECINELEEGNVQKAMRLLLTILFIDK